jgi:type I restriction enzyme M protein
MLLIVDRETLSQYDLAYEWDDAGSDRLVRSDRLYSSRPPEILFIERCYHFLKPGGRMAIVLPDGILGNPELYYVRYWILERFRLVASLDLHPDTFQPKNGTQTSILILQRKTEKELTQEARQGQLNNYEIFMAELHACGHDKRGNRIFRRTDEGDEIWIDDDLPTEMATHADGKLYERRTPKRKIIDDDSPSVAVEFLEWKAKAVLGW